MSYNTAPENFSQVLNGFCKRYTDEIRQEVADGLEEIGKETLSEVKRLSPVYKGKSKKLTKGKYKRGWTLSATQTRGTIKITVHNKQYQLVHLLELGHLTRKGTGRTAGKGKEYSRVYKHAETAEAHAEEKVNALLERIVK
ncbi:MAG: HK97 gp10 family phage protein [Ruminococcus sp.]|nr:HK97 gp10 family phage protein [Ruminococcus sp.]